MSERTWRFKSSRPHRLSRENVAGVLECSSPDPLKTHLDTQKRYAGEVGPILILDDLAYTAIAWAITPVA